MRLHWIFILVAILLTLFLVRYVRSWLRFSWRATFWLLLLGAVATATVYATQRSPVQQQFEQSRSDSSTIVR